MAANDGRIATSSVTTFAITDEATGHDVVYVQRLDGLGQPVEAPIQVTSSALSAIPRSAILLSDGGIVVNFDYADPSETGTPYPFFYLAYARFDAQDTPLGTTTLALDDYNASASIRTVATGAGGFAYVLDTTRGDFGAAFETQSLGFVDADGHVATRPLYATSHSDTPLPFAVQSPATIAYDDAKDLVSVSFQVRYTDQNPDYPSPSTPTGRETHAQIFTEDGRLLRATTTGFDGQPDLTTSSVTTTLKTGLHNLTLVGNDAITGYGNDLDNSLVGNTGKNHLVGGAGDDRLAGGLGTDYLQGGAGADTFVFDARIKGVFNSDLVADFVHGVDHIALSSAIFTGLAPGALAAGAFADLATGPAGPGAHILYDAAGNLSFDADGAGSGPAYQFATLAGRPVLTASDFIVA